MSNQALPLVIIIVYVPYPRERGPMGGASYIGPRLGDGPIFKVSVACLNVKEHPGKLRTHTIFIIILNSSSGYTIDCSLSYSSTVANPEQIISCS